jgi:hypothetical protein
MALKKILQDKDIEKELILDNNSEAHISEEDISPPESYSNTEEDSRTDTAYRDWVNTTYY